MNKLLGFLIVACVSLMMISAVLMPMHHDEAVFLTIGKRMALGELPYQDYFDHKTPGIYWVGMGMYRWFGNSLMAVRLLVVSVNLISGLLVYLIIKQLNGLKVNNSNAWLGVVAFLIMSIWYQGNFFLTESFVMLFVLLSLLLLVSNKLPKNISWFLACVMLGVAVIFKQTAIFYLLGLGVYLLILVISKKGDGGVQLLSLIAGAILPAFGLFFWLFANGLVHDFFHQAIEFNLLNYSPVPLLTTLIESVKILMPAGFVWALGFAGLIKLVKWDGGKLAAVGIMGLSILPIMFFRPYHHYWLQFLPFAVIGFAYVTEILNHFGKTQYKQVQDDIKYSRFPVVRGIGLVTLVGMSLYFLFFVSNGFNAHSNQSRLMTANIMCDEITTVESYYYLDCVPSKMFYEVGVN